jgi:hypothetical protein
VIVDVAHRPARRGAVMSHGGILAAALLVGLLSTAIPYSIDQSCCDGSRCGRFAVLQALLPVVATVMVGDRARRASFVGGARRHRLRRSARRRARPELSAPDLRWSPNPWG